MQEKTNLYRANLQRANLFEAHLEEAILYEAQLQNTVLQSARLQGANLYQAILQCADLDGAYLQASYLQEANMQGANLSYTRLQGATLSNARLQGAALTFTSLQGAILNQVRLEGTGEQVWSSSTSFADRLRMSIGKETDLYRVLFGGGIGQGGVDSLIKGLSNNRAMELRDSLRPHIGKPVSYQLPENSGAIIGSYTEEDAEKWIAEYKEAMFEVLEDES